MVVEYKDLIKGEIYDLQLRAYERREKFNHNNVYVEVRPTPEYLNNMAFVGFTYTNKFLIFKKHLDMTYVIKHPENKVYIKTIGDVLSKNNPDKEQSSAALQALTPLYGNTDMRRHIMKYGGKKKSKRKTKKRKAIKTKKSIKTRRTKKHVKKSRKIKK